MTHGPAPEPKAALRERLLAARRAAPREVRDREAQVLAEHLDRLVADDHAVCAYVPVGSEPGSLVMLDRLAGRGVRVLLPVARTGDDGAPQALSWGEYRPGKLVAARFGLLEPPQPWLAADAVAGVGLVVVPALAVDRRGVRLGRGAGYYDRSLGRCGPRTRLVALVRDAELLDELPADSHDVPMTHALTPGYGLITLGRPPE